MRITCHIEEIDMDGDYTASVEGVQATCSRCGHTVESYGTDERSVRRCLAVMREECPEGENNFYRSEAGAP